MFYLLLIRIKEWSCCSIIDNIIKLWCSHLQRIIIHNSANVYMPSLTPDANTSRVGLRLPLTLSARVCSIVRIPLYYWRYSSAICKCKGWEALPACGLDHQMVAKYKNPPNCQLLVKAVLVGPLDWNTCNLFSLPKSLGHIFCFCPCDCGDVWKMDSGFIICNVDHLLLSLK